MLTTNATSNIPPGCEQLNDGDTSFMIMATTFVMLQTPALGLAQAGIIRRKNALSMLMQTLTGFVIGSLLWFICGFSLSFGPSFHGFIGNLQHSFLENVPVNTCFVNSTAKTIPGILFAAFQMMFAVMVPVIVTGAWAERMLFEAFILFVLLWPFLVYYPLAHWVWNTKGFLAAYGVMDFAGGLTIHTSSGVAAFAVTLVLSGRMKLNRKGLAHHNLPIAILGGALIWGGWYSFNGGSAFKSNGQASMAVMNTHISACVGAMIWTILSYRREKHWHLTEIMNGAYAGLAAITPGSGFVTPQSAFFIGILGGISSYVWIVKIIPRTNLDDALDVTGLQGAPGIIGTICVGLFATEEYASPAGYFVSYNLELFVKQLVGVSITIVWTLVTTYLLMLLIKKLVGIDVSPDVEEKGLDLTQIGEQAYDESLAPVLDLGTDVLTSKLCEACHNGDFPKVRSLIQLGAKAESHDYDKRSPLHITAGEGNVEILKYLIENFPINVNSQDRYGNTPLADAVRHNNTECIQVLKNHGGKIMHGTGYFASKSILSAAFSGNAEEVRWILEQDLKCKDEADYDARTPLHLAASEGHIEVLKLLLHFGAKVDVIDRWQHTPYYDAIYYHHHECAKLLRLNSNSNHKNNGNNKSNNSNHSSTSSSSSSNSNMSERTPLLLSSSTTTVEMKGNKTKNDNSSNNVNENVEEWKIDFEENIQERKELNAADRALFQAASVGDFSELKKLVKRGANINLKDYDDRSVLHLSASAGHVDIVQYLIKSDGVIIDVFDRFGNTPLQDAIDHGYINISNILRTAGATIKNPTLAAQLCKLAAEGNLKELKKLEIGSGIDIHVCDYDGRTALHLAACNNNIEIVKWILKIGGRFSNMSRDRYGNTALDDATRYKYSEIVQLLRETFYDV